MRFLLVSSNDTTIAVPLADVREVLERVDVIPLPRARGATLGAAPVAGSVIPVVGLGTARSTDGPALVLDGRDGRFAWVVDRIHGLVTVDHAAVSALTPSQEQPFVGVHANETGSVLHVSLEHLEPEWFGDREPTHDLSNLGHAVVAADRALKVVHDDQSLIVVRAGRELVAIPLPEVFEIQTSDSFVRLPVRESAVVGLSMVRGTPTLALDLARLIGSDGSSGSVVIVVKRPAAPVALRVDEVIGLRRYDASRDFVPATTKGVAEGFVVNGADGSTPMLLDIARTVDRVLERHLQIAPIGQQRTEATKSTTSERKLLIVNLARELGALDASLVERVVDAPPMTPLRSAKAPWLVGAVDVGGRVLPVCDVRTAFGAHVPGASSRLVLVRDAFGDVVIALAVDDVEGLVSLDESRVEPFSLARFGPASGVVRLDDGRIASLVKPEGLLDRASLATAEAS